MPHDLGLRDEARFADLPEEGRETLLFQVEFCLDILGKRPDYREALEMAANALTALGYYEKGLELDRRLSLIFPADKMVVYNFACSLSLCGRLDEAFSELKKAIDLGYHESSHMLSDPDLANLRADPRFRILLSEAK
jgi:tetratricopeptide (TPR) repeat protein